MDSGAGGTHWSEVVANHSIDFIELAKKDDKPFFMYLAFNATHDPRQSPKKYIDMYPLDSIKVPRNYLNLYPYKDDIGCSKKLRAERLAHVEFQDLMPIIKGEKETAHKTIYGKYINHQRMIAKGDWKLIMYPAAKKYRLFNTKKDPQEMDDLSSNPEYASKMAELKSSFLELQKKMGDTLDIDNPEAVKEK